MFINLGLGYLELILIFIRGVEGTFWFEVELGSNVNVL